VAVPTSAGRDRGRSEKFDERHDPRVLVATIRVKLFAKGGAVSDPDRHPGLDLFAFQSSLNPPSGPQEFIERNGMPAVTGRVASAG
jgi:hypothetical protein